MYFALTGLLLVTAAVLMIVRREVDLIEAQSVKAFPAALAGAASGLLSGLTGVGGGVFLTTLIIALGWASPNVRLHFRRHSSCATQRLAWSVFSSLAKS